MSPRRQSPLTLEFILLGIIARSPIHGYNIYKELSRLDGLGMVWEVKQSLLYAILDKLENEGLIQSTRLESETRPTRKEYHLTTHGLEEYERWRSTPVSHQRDLRQEFLARLYFARQAGDETTRTLLTQQARLAQTWLEEINSQISSAAPDQDYEKTVLLFRKRQVEAALDWLHYCESVIGETK